MGKMGKKLLSILAISLLISGGIASVVHAQTAQGGFSVQVSPSPIIETVQPGVTKTIDLRIRNQNTAPETLKMGLKAFTISNETGEVSLQTEEPADVKDWVTFAQPTFDVAAGEWYTQKITFATPVDAGFTYSFAITVSRANPTQGSGGQTAIEGSVAIFALLTTDKPGATRKIDLQSLVSKKKVYEYLPASFTLELKNSGNTIVQPTGNIFIQRSENSTSPIAVLPVNATSAYILPGVNRALVSDWVEGFPMYKSDPTNPEKKNLVWDWSKVQNFRIGHYVAKVVVVYNDGTRDIPIETTVGFWVIPWKMLLVLFVIVAVLIVGVVTLVRKLLRTAHKKTTHKKPTHEPEE